MIQLRETIVRADVFVAIDAYPSGRAGALAADAYPVRRTLSGTRQDGERGVEALIGVATASIKYGHDTRMGVHIDREARLRRAIRTQEVVRSRPAFLFQQHEIWKAVVDVDIVHGAVDLSSFVDGQLNDGLTSGAAALFGE